MRRTSSPLVRGRRDNVVGKLHKTFGSRWFSPVTLDRFLAYVNLRTLSPALLMHTTQAARRVDSNLRSDQYAALKE